MTKTTKKELETRLNGIADALAATLGEIDGLELQDPYITDARGFVLQAGVSVDKYRSGHGMGKPGEAPKAAKK